MSPKQATVVVDRPDTPVLLLEGKDVRRFCNGMFTNNVRDLPVGEGHRTAMCDAKGRLHGLLDLFLEREDRVLVLLEGVSAAEFEERYGKYIVFDDVELTDLTNDVHLFSIQGPQASAVVSAVGLPIPERAVAASERATVVRRNRTREGGFDILVRGGALTRQDLVAAGATEALPAELEVARVELGKVRWPVDMPGRFLLHELGLRDEVCSFEKGCYIGQEIIHRLDVMGQLRKRLVGVRLAARIDADGALVLHQGQEVGRLTSVVQSPSLGPIGLSVVRMPADVPGTAVEVAVGDARVKAIISALPFPPADSASAG
jgi:folate-binding protein YgfZ